MKRNWYGTGHSGLNWRENEFTIEVQPAGFLGETPLVKSISQKPPRLEIVNELMATQTGESDASLYYSLDNSNEAILRGNVLINSSANLIIRCSVPDSSLFVADELTRILRGKGVEVSEEPSTGSTKNLELKLIGVHQSPPLSKLIEPFLRISINMYGEVLVRTIAHHTKIASQSDAPSKVLPTYVRTLLNDDLFLKGMATTDGSGLSRSNRLTTNCLAKILLTLQNETWFHSSFYNAFPTINDIRMKSGTLLNTIAYAGYLPNNSLVFSFMIHNVHGLTAQETRVKIWNLLDVLK